jgi:chemotaxis protein methyltransferase CheR
MGAPDPVDRLRAAIAARAGLDVGGGRGVPFLPALERAAAEAGRAAAAHAEALVADPLALDGFVEALTVGETWLFRERGAWERIEREILPGRLAARLRAGGRERLRAWCAGCSTGEEAFSLAIVLAEARVPAPVHLVATDLSAAAVARARRGALSEWSLRGAAAARARPWLREEDGGLLVAPGIVDRIRFGVHNLALPGWQADPLGLSDLDLVLCRNVLIYLAPEVVREVAGRLLQALAPGGWLVTGAADPPLAGLAPFEVRTGPEGAAYRRPEGTVRGRGPAAARAPHPSLSPLARGEGDAAALARGGEDASPLAGRNRARPAAKASSAAAPTAPTAENPASPADPPAPDAVALARRALDEGRPAEALAALDRLVAERPLLAAAHLDRALALLELGREDEAEEACRRARYLDPGEPYAHFLLGTIRRRRGDLHGAARAFAAAARLAGDGPPVPRP